MSNLIVCLLVPLRSLLHCLTLMIHVIFFGRHAINLKLRQEIGFLHKIAYTDVGGRRIRGIQCFHETGQGESIRLPNIHRFLKQFLFNLESSFFHFGLQAARQHKWIEFNHDCIGFII